MCDVLKEHVASRALVVGHRPCGWCHRHRVELRPVGVLGTLKPASLRGKQGLFGHAAKMPWRFARIHVLGFGMHYDPARFTIANVADLPWPHRPFRCAHRARFDALATARARIEWRESQIAFRRFYGTLTDADVGACPYHQVDWHAAARIAIAILRAHRESFDWITVEEITRAEVDDDAIVGAVSSLFSEPIRWAPNDGFITNGQHRICALKYANVGQVVASVN